MQSLSPRIYRFNDFELDALKRQLLHRGQPVTLQPKAFDLLLALVENRGRLLTKDDLLNLVWPDQIVEESNLTVHMSALRKALGEQKGEHRFVVTEPGRGYRFVAELQPDEDLVIERHTISEIVIEEENEDVESNVTRQVARRAPVIVEATPAERALTGDALPGPGGSRKGRVVLLLAGGLILLALVGGFALRRYSRPANESLSAAPASATVPFADIQVRQLTTKGQVSWGALSPDGKFYAYVLNDRGENKNS